MAGLWKINSVRPCCWERIILVLPALKWQEASVLSFNCCQREGWYFCATPYSLVTSFEDDLEKKGEHMMAPTFCVRRDDEKWGRDGKITVCCCGVCLEGYEMHLVTETELQPWLLIQPKANPCTEIWAYKCTHKFIPPIPAHPWSQLRGFVKQFPLCQFGLDVSSVVGTWCVHTLGLSDKSAIWNFTICWSS